MLIQLPIEVWMEILDWLGRKYRRELAAKFDQFGDYTFSEFYQHWLHKYTKNVQLGLLTIEQEIVFNKVGKEESKALLKVCFPLLHHQPPKRVINDRDHRRVKVPFADVPMPENITGCKELQISYLDSGVLNFFRLMMPAFVSSSTALHIIMTDTGSRLDDTALNEEDYTRMRTALRHLLPLFINASFSDFSFHSRTSTIFSFILHHCPQQLFSAKLIRFSDATHPIVPSIVRWLCTKRTDAEPRIAIFYGLNSVQLCEAICEAIQEQFLGAVSPVSFYTRITILAVFRVPTHFPESSHKNEATGEQLIVRKHPNKHNYCLIGRFSSADVVDRDQWLRKMGASAIQIQGNYHLSGIKLFQPSIGPMESTAAGEDEEGSSAAMIPSKKRRRQEQQGEEKEGIDQPGPSKKHRN